jgi:glycosyltransferase involved in cell wall biosynthesis
MKGRIAFIATMSGSPWGGSEELWYRVAKEFLKSDYSVQVIVRHWSPLPGAVVQLEKLGASVNFVKGLSLFDKVRNVLSKKSLLTEISSSQEALESFKPDLTIISQGANIDGLPWMDFCCKKSLKFVTIAQAASESIWPDDARADLLIASFEKSLANYYVSKSNLKLTEKQTGTHIKNGRVVFNPFNVDYSTILPYPEMKENYKLAMVARLEPKAKGQDILFETLSDQKWKSRNMAVSLYGNGPNERALKRLRDYFGLKNIEFCGTDHPKKIWQGHQALILPSRFEGLPLSLVEAMLSGRFGIITDVSGNCEVVKDNINGFVAAGPNAFFLDEALERAWQRREEWEHIGKNAAEYIRTIVPADPIRHLYLQLQSLIS